MRMPHQPTATFSPSLARSRVDVVLAVVVSRFFLLFSHSSLVLSPSSSPSPFFSPSSSPSPCSHNPWLRLLHFFPSFLLFPSRSTLRSLSLFSYFSHKHRISLRLPLSHFRSSSLVSILIEIAPSPRVVGLAPRDGLLLSSYVIWRDRNYIHRRDSLHAFIPEERKSIDSHRSLSLSPLPPDVRFFHKLSHRHPFLLTSPPFDCSLFPICFLHRRVSSFLTIGITFVLFCFIRFLFFFY